MKHVTSFLLLSLLVGGSLCANKNEEDAASFVEVLEAEYEDKCVDKAEAEWALLLDKPDALEEKLDNDKEFGAFAKDLSLEMKPMKNTLENSSPALKRRVELILNPGEALLPSEQWLSFVEYVDKAEYQIQHSKEYTCGKDKPETCSYSELLSTIASSKDHATLDAAKQSWESNLPNKTQFERNILPLLQDASVTSGKSNNIKHYWEMLLEYSDAFNKAEEIWDQISPLYEKLQKFVAKKLELNTTLIPAHWLGSLFGDDWSNVAMEVVPHPNILQEINKNMQKKQLGGRTAFKSASNLLKRLGLGELKDIFWRDSVFEQSCPTRLVNFCQSGTVRVFTCKNISFPLYLDAHDAAWAVKNAEIKASYSINTHILREANRISPLSDAISGVGSLVAISPEELGLEILPSASKNKNTKLTLQFITALRDLPKLSYYYAADQFRLELFKTGKPSSIRSLWSRTRSDISKLSTSDNDFLGDEHILGNKPYIGKFLATTLKYQLLKVLTNNDEENTMLHLSQSSAQLKKLMSEGFLHSWQNVLRENVGISRISGEDLLEYYQMLDEYLTSEIGDVISTNNNNDNDLDTYDQEPDEEEKVDEYNVNHNVIDKIIEDPQAPVDFYKDVDGDAQPVEDSKVNQNQINSEPAKDNIENPYLVAKDDASSAASSSEQEDEKLAVQEASALQYAWIALGVLLLIIVILAIVIARKRYKHKKELEKERREAA